MTWINSLKNKQNKQKGITLLYALLAIALFSVVEIVIFNAASANYARLKDEKINQQTYLTVSSAAKTFTDAIVGDKVTYEVVEEKYSDVTRSSDMKSFNYIPNETPGIKKPYNPQSVTDFIEKHVEKYTKTNDKELDANRISSCKFVINASYDDKSLDTVYVDMKIDRYDITALFSNWDQVSDKPKHIYYITVKIPFAKDGNVYAPIIDGSPETIIDEKDHTHSTVTTTYKVDWDAGNLTIVRGKDQ